jgi:phospholipid/cholesterol/gamma-HCH transport system permease protein
VASIPTPSQLPDDSAPGGVFGWFVAFICHIGGVVINGYDSTIRGMMALGDFTLFATRTLSWMFSRVPRRGTVWPNFYEVGVKSLPVVALTGTFIGMVLAVQSYFQFKQIGLETRLGGVINMTLLRELGPVLAATMLAGRVGSAMAAELGTMRVTQQIDALSAMGVNPVHYLVVPRFMACLFLIPTLTVMADFMGVAGGHFYSVNVLGIDIHHYWHNSAKFVTNFDLFVGLFKSVFFGAAIAMVSCYQGFNCTDGAEGVGSASTSSFVYSFVAILVLDLFLGIALDSVYFTMYPEGASLL